MLLVALAGCAPGKSIVTVTVDADAASPIGPVDHFVVTPSDDAGHTAAVTVPVGATIPPAATFSLRFDATVKETVHVAVAAVDGSGVTLGSATGDVAVKPSATTTLALTLTAPAAVGTTLAFTVQPSDAAVKSSIKPPVQVTVQDAAGNLVASDGIDVTIALATNPSSATLGGTLTQTTTGGVATFADLTVDTLGSGYTLTATATGLTAATSSAFDVTPPVWTPATKGISGANVNWVVFDPASGMRAYAATNDAGVFKSSDGGASWVPANSGLLSRTVNAVAVDPFNAMRVLAATAAGMFVSNDAGATWAQANSGYSAAVGESPTRIFFEPATANKVWMATSKPNVYVSAGATGISWDSRSDSSWLGLPANARATGLGVDAAGSVYVTTFNNMGGMFRLASGAISWTQMTTPIPNNYIDSLLVDRVANNIWVGCDTTGVGGDLFKGSTTTYALAVTGLPLTFIEGIGVAPSNAQIMFVTGFDASDPFIYKSSNGGANWAAAATGLPTTTDFRPHQSTIAIDPADPTHVLYPSPSGLFRTTDGGGTWAASSGGLSGWPIAALTTLTGTANLVVAGTPGGGIFRSTDGGANWAVQTIGDKVVRALAAANGKLYAGTQSQIATSPDGATWTTVAGTGTTNALAVAPSNTMEMFAATGTTMSVSADGGATWSASGALTGSNQPTSVAVDPTNPMIVYVGTDGTGVYRSANGGGTWGQTNSGLSNLTVHAVAVSPTTATTVFAGTDGGIFRSTDGGSSWSLGGGTAGVGVLSFALHPTKGNVMFASSSSGVLQSVDGGATWKALNAGLGDSIVDIVTLDLNDPNTLWAGTNSAGVFVARP